MNPTLDNKTALGVGLGIASLTLLLGILYAIEHPKRALAPWLPYEEDWERKRSAP